MKKTRHKLVLTGYEHEDIKSFIKKLEQNNVDILIDVRELPLSRKKSFSKNELAFEVGKKKIEYVHYKSLGSPREIRHKLKSSELSYREFFSLYRKHLIENDEALVELSNMLKDNDVCIMCYEEQTSACHRTIIVDELLKRRPSLQVLAI